MHATTAHGEREDGLLAFTLRAHGASCCDAALCGGCATCAETSGAGLVEWQENILSTFWITLWSREV